MAMVAPCGTMLPSAGFSIFTSITAGKNRLLRLTALLCFALLFLASVKVDGQVHQTKKVSVSEVSFDSAVDDIQWAGPSYSTVIVKTAAGRLFVSQDSGKTWNEKTEVLHRAKATKGKPDVAVEQIIVNPVDRSIVVIVGTKRAHFISTDSAKTFRAVEVKGAIHNWIPHSKKTNWALLSIWTNACTRSGGRGVDDVDCNHVLYVTKDLGRTFHLIATYVVQYSWGDPKHKQQDNVYFTHHRHKTGPQLRGGGWSHSVDFSVGDTHGSPHTPLVVYGNKFLSSNGYIFVAKLLDEETQVVSLMVSTDGGKVFNAAKLPTTLHEKSYTILDTSEGAVILHVNHGNLSSKESGNVYISDAKGLRFTLSLPNNIRTSAGDAEFDRVMSLDGVYLANFKDQNYNTPKRETFPSPTTETRTAEPSEMSSDDLDDDVEEESQEDEEWSAIETEMEKRRRIHRGKSEEAVRTVISFDKGGVWNYLKPPRVDSRGNQIQCPNPTRCWLHLHGVSNFHQFAPYYSVANAVGLVMGSGNVGSQLRYEEDEVNTYLSRDGGLSWFEAHKGAYIYEFGDHGGLIVMADDLKKTNQVVFSWNEGQSWYDFELGSAPVEIDNIVIEPNSSSVEFLAYGTRGDTGVLFHLDFAALQQPPCKGVWAADSVSSDYETWSASDGRHSGGEMCLLGRETVFTRRKQTSECFNGRNFDRPIVKRNCRCTQEDYECDFGFTRSIDSMKCHPDMESPDILTPMCRTGKYYTANAYRKVPGDTCEDGWKPELMLVPCPPHSPLSAGAKTVLSVLFLIVVFVGIVAFISKNPDWSPVLFNYGMDSFKQVRYTVIGGLKGDRKKEKSGNKFSTFQDDESDEAFGETGDDSTALGVFTARRRQMGGDGKISIGVRGRVDKDNSYAPELGFIESAQDESEADAPSLMKYQYKYEDVSSDEDGMDILGTSKDTKNSAPTSDLFDKSPPTLRDVKPSIIPGAAVVPRLAPPPSSGQSRVGGGGSSV